MMTVFRLITYLSIFSNALNVHYFLKCIYFGLRSSITRGGVFTDNFVSIFCKVKSIQTQSGYFWITPRI